MAKRVWISMPLTTTADLKDESVVAFLKGGSKKDLEVEVAAFITKWLMDRDIPFGIDFDSCGVDRAVVIESLPKRLQKILGATAAVVAEPGEVAPNEPAQVAEPVAVEVTEVEEAVPAEEPGSAMEIAEAHKCEAEVVGDDPGIGGPSELR